MKNYVKSTILLVALVLFASCAKNNDPAETCTPSIFCEYTLTNGEITTTVDAKVIGTYELSYTLADTDSPFDVGLSATVEITADEMIISLEGKECISLKNPFRTATGVQDIFRDHCRDHVSYHISTKQDGSFNELNLFALDNEWYGQFTIK